MTAAVRLAYLSNARLPSEKANALQSLQQCEAFGRRVPLEFWHPRRNGAAAPPGLVFSHYGIAPTFELRTLPSMDPLWLRRRSEKTGFLVQATSFQAACVGRLLRESGPVVVYTRNSLDLFVLPLLKRLPAVRAVYLEDHDGVTRRAPALKRRLLRHADGLVVTTELHAEAARELGVSGERILVAPNAVNLDRFPPAGPVPAGPPYRIIYVGNLFRRKGVFTLVQALSRLPETYSLEIAGGSPESRPAFEAHLQACRVGPRVRMHGVLAPPAVPALLQIAHVAVLPNSTDSDVSSRYTSPLKMFEYMAAGVPIVASDVPAIRQVLRHDVNAWLVPPDEPAALAAGLAHVCGHPEIARRLAAQARRDVLSRTWDARAERILTFIGLPAAAKTR